VIIATIELGDTFVHENGTKYQVDNIFCAYDEQEKRWETSIGYQVIPKDPSYSTLRNVVKARDFVVMIQEQGGIGENFVTQISGSAQPVTPAAEEISFTPGSVFSRNSTATVALPGPSQIEQDFFRFARKYGMQASDLHREVTIATNGSPRKYKIAGINPRNHKYPILCRKIRTGTLYKFQADRVKNALV
jgi:hypothetical protein